MHELKKPPTIEEIRAHMRDHVHQVSTGNPTVGIEIYWLIRVIANMYETMHTVQYGGQELSGPRIGLLFRLFGEEHINNSDGVTPSELSQNQNVSRNTISALLRGLEDQKLIERQLDPHDRRHFRIRLSEDGRNLVKKLGPEHIGHFNQVTSALTLDEQSQLLQLLSKLFNSLRATCQVCPQFAHNFKEQVNEHHA